MRASYLGQAKSLNHSKLQHLQIALICQTIMIGSGAIGFGWQ